VLPPQSAGRDSCGPAITPPLSTRPRDSPAPQQLPRTSNVTRSPIYTVDSAIEANLERMQREKDREHERALAEIRLKIAEAELQKQSQSSQAALEMERQRLEIERQRLEMEAQSRREADAHKERLLAMDIKLMELKLLYQNQALRLQEMSDISQ
jgi:hypothetical protein